MTNGNDRDDDVIDPRVRALYRGASSEEPPAHLDAALRAAARRTVAAGPVVAFGSGLAALAHPFDVSTYQPHEVNHVLGVTKLGDA